MPTSIVAKRCTVVVNRDAGSGNGASYTSPELNRIEILCKQAKYFWRKFVRLTGGALVDEVDSFITNYETEFTISFR